MDEELFLGCDVGGSGSCAIVLNRTAETIAFHRGGAGNPHAVGFDSSLSTISELLSVVLGSRKHRLRALTVCISGGECPDIQSRYRAGLQESLGLSAAVRVMVLHDVIAPLGLMMSQPKHCRTEDQVSCTPSRIVVVIAGTGSVSAKFSVDRASEKASKGRCFSGDGFAVEIIRKCGGWGPILGDEGSGYAISVRALSLALQIIDRMVVMSPIEPFLRPKSEGQVDEHFEQARVVLNSAVNYYLEGKDTGIGSGFQSSLNALVTYIYKKDTSRGEIASFASQVARLASHHNTICLQAFWEAGVNLGQLVMSAIGPHSSGGAGAEEGCRLRICGVGGVFSAIHKVPVFADGFRKTLIDAQRRKDEIYFTRPCFADDRKDPIAFACAHLAALTVGCSNGAWQTKAAGLLFKFS